MPTRMIDGDALWRSDKLSQIQPPAFRAEYANLIPLALADGTFECNPRRVWADVYSYNRSDVKVETVEKILDEFERVGLLRRKRDESGKIWGFWNGIESRLPSESTRERYKSGKSNIFNPVESIATASRPNHDDIVPRLDLDKNELDRDGGTFRNLAIRYRSFFGQSHSKNSQFRNNYAVACQKFGEDAVLAQFEEWAAANVWRKERLGNQGLRFFLADLPELLAERTEAAELTSKREGPSVDADAINEAANVAARREVDRQLSEARAEAEMLKDLLVDQF